MFTSIPWRYALKETPLDGQLVWVRRDAWSDRPAVMTWHTATATFTASHTSPGGIGPVTISVPIAHVLAWRFQNADDQDLYLTSTP